MLFSSITFIYYFLPILLICYFLTPKKHRNKVLLIFSLIFYFLGEPKYFIVLIASCLINYCLGKKIATTKSKKIYLIIAIIYNVGQLIFFKYTNFFVENLNSLFNIDIPYLNIIMPLGISFFTFQALAYLIDIYRKNHGSAKSIIDFMTYITLFPQLIAGPIVRYKDVETKIYKRSIDIKTFSSGIKRFIIGLSKKVLLANVLGEIIKELITTTVVSSWLKPILYTMQIYFDFSGYSDMAIGLGLMFGFHFLENFNYPLIASSITDFWHRWHISLSSWFKDYVYIPLKGNRTTKIKWLRNILIVWSLTGLWHGANWNFIIWGLYFGIILVIEKLYLKPYLDKTKVLKHIYTLFLVIISFLIFSTENPQEIIRSLKNMFNLSNISFVNQEMLYHLKSNLILIIISIIGATPLIKILKEKLEKTKLKKGIDALEPFIYISLLILATAYLIDASFNPFLYFRF